MIKPIRFLKSNCFPKNITVLTTEVKNEEGRLMGYITTITDDQEREITEFKHTELRTRLLWVDGYFRYHRMHVKENTKIPVW
ncbi:MAG: hypothetical protein WC333_00340 [Dehalococcoidia bacterium]|jgi:hypothetical protein